MHSGWTNYEEWWQACLLWRRLLLEKKNGNGSDAGRHQDKCHAQWRFQQWKLIIRWVASALRPRKWHRLPYQVSTSIKIGRNKVIYRIKDSWTKVKDRSTLAQPSISYLFPVLWEWSLYNSQAPSFSMNYSLDYSLCSMAPSLSFTAKSRPDNLDIYHHCESKARVKPQLTSVIQHSQAVLKEQIFPSIFHFPNYTYWYSIPSSPPTAFHVVPSYSHCRSIMFVLYV